MSTESSHESGHSSEEVARALAGKLATRARHVCVLLGAGASCAAGLPGLTDLQQTVVGALHGDDRETAEALLTERNLEQAISRLRRIQTLLEDGEELAGMSGNNARDLDRTICEAIVSAVDSSAANLDAFIRLASWAARMETHMPVELFTVNYDLLIERGLEHLGVPYFDGFIGGVEPPFAPELVDPTRAPSSRSVPSGFVRLWKLHGSTNWRTREVGGTRTTVRVADSSAEGAAAIYPSDEKYDEARRVPFVVLMDRFRQALIEPETITLVTGYSFGDAHLNEMIFDAARRHPRSEVVALCYSDIPKLLVTEAESTRNLVVLARSEAIIGGQRALWKSSDDLPGVFVNGSFLLGSFENLTGFLSRHIGQSDD